MELFFPLQFLLYFDYFELMHPYANAIISSLEDPENILEQGVLDMNNDLIKVCQATTRVCNEFVMPFCFIYTHIYIFCIPLSLVINFYIPAWVLLLFKFGTLGYT